MDRRSGYQPDDINAPWICLVRGACHADSVTYDVDRHRPEPLPNLRRDVLAAGRALLAIAFLALFLLWAPGV